MVVTSGAVKVFFAGVGSAMAGVAAPEGAADRGAGVGALGGGTKMSTSYEGTWEEASKGAVKMAVWSTSSYV